MHLILTDTRAAWLTNLASSSVAGELITPKTQGKFVERFTENCGFLRSTSGSVICLVLSAEVTLYLVDKWMNE